MKRLAVRLRGLVQKPERVFLILATVFGLFSAFIIPQLSVPDENMHFLRSYTMSTGHMTGDSKNECTFPQDVHDRAYSIYEGDYGSHFKQKINPNENTKEWCGTAATYSPFVHIPQAIGFFIANQIWPSTGVMILLGRLVNLALFVSVMYFVIKKVRLGKWVFAVIALFPTVIQQAASLSADSFTFVATFAAIAFMLNLAVQKTSITWRQIVVLLLLSAALALSKLPNLVLILFLLFLPARLFLYNFKAKSWLLKPFTIKIYIFLAAGLFAILVEYIWLKICGQPLVSSTVDNPIPSHPWQFLSILFHTYVYMDPKSALFGFTGLGGFGDFIMSSAVGSFASYRYWLPQILIFLCYALLIFAVLKPNKIEDALLRGISTGKIALGGVVALGILVVGITYSLYVIWALPLLGPEAHYAAGLQGRYFIAALVILIPLGIWLRKYIKINVKSNLLFCAIIAATSGFLLLFYALQTLYVMRLGFF